MLGLLRLHAAESRELRLALGDIQDGLGALLADFVAKQTVSKGAITSSRGIDSRRLKASTWTWAWTWSEKHALELAKRGVGLEHVAESDEATHVAVVADAVSGETMRQKASTVSGY